MAKEIENDNGEKETVYTAEEVEAAKAQGAAEILATKEAEIAELKRVNAERGENMTKYSQMSEEEKAAYDANTTNLLKREEALQSEIEGLKTTITEKEKKENASAKNNALQSIHNGDDKIKAELESNYEKLAGMPESTQDEINARVSAAARMAGIIPDPRNPLYTPVNGEAPKYKPNEQYIDTPQGQEAAALVRDAMGIVTKQ